MFADSHRIFGPLERWDWHARRLILGGTLRVFDTSAFSRLFCSVHPACHTTGSCLQRQQGQRPANLQELHRQARAIAIPMTLISDGTHFDLSEAKVVRFA